MTQTFLRLKSQNTLPRPKTKKADLALLGLTSLRFKPVSLPTPAIQVFERFQGIPRVRVDGTGHYASERMALATPRVLKVNKSRHPIKNGD